jgi:putative transposase
MNEIDPKALFRLSVLGPVVSRERLDRGELQQLIRELAQREYAIPGTARRHVAEKTIQAWYHSWRKEGIQGLVPKTRVDRGQSKITPVIQEAVLAAKRENPRRSIRQIVRLLEAAGIVASQSLSRSAVHRLLQQSGLSKLAGASSAAEEKRSFTAEFAGTIWYGDVMHGPRVPVKGQLRKTYLVSLFDDASRLVAHSALQPGRDGTGHRRRAQAGAVEKRCAHPHRGRQRRCLSRQYAAGYLCPTGHPLDFLPPLSADQQGEVGALAQNRKGAVPERAR